MRLAPSDPAVAYVTVRDVLYGIFAFLHQLVTKAEYDLIPTGQAKSDDAVSEPGFHGDFDSDFQTATTQPEAEEERAKHEVVSQAQEEERDVVLIIYPDADDCQGRRFLRQRQSIPTDTPRNV